MAAERGQAGVELVALLPCLLLLVAALAQGCLLVLCAVAAERAAARGRASSRARSSRRTRRARGAAGSARAAAYTCAWKPTAPSPSRWTCPRVLPLPSLSVGAVER